jgi:hypothetical protein
MPMNQRQKELVISELVKANRALHAAFSIVVGTQPLPKTELDLAADLRELRKMVADNVSRLSGGGKLTVPELFA